MANFDNIEILLAEDSAADAEMCLRALRKGHLPDSIYWVKDGAEALDFVHCRGVYTGRNPNNAPKLVLLDLKMPKVDGLEVLRELKGNPLTRSIPVVMMTSSNEESDVVESYRLGVNSYIVKPLNYTRFAEVVTMLGIYWIANRAPH